MKRFTVGPAVALAASLIVVGESTADFIGLGQAGKHHQGIHTNVNRTQAMSDAIAAAARATAQAAALTVPGKTIVMTNPSQSVPISGAPGRR